MRNASGPGGRLAGYELIDGLLLALSLWPNPPNDHRLALLAERLNVDLERYTWRRALSDCRLLVTVIRIGARELRTWNPELVDLLLTVCDDSPVWGLLADLACIAPSGAIRQPVAVAATLADELAARAVIPRRTWPAGDSRRSLHVSRRSWYPVRLWAPPGGSTRICSPRSPTAGNSTRGSRRGRWPRARQLAVRRARRAGGGARRDGRGSGASCAGLEWVRSGHGRRAVIATPTKQLRTQLARDVQRLVNAGIGMLADATDLVKGASNRLSLRGLTLGLVDACSPRCAQGAAWRSKAQRELLAYLAVQECRRRPAG